jgi:lysophospholipase L1-like esterase
MYYDTPSLAKDMTLFNQALIDVCKSEAVPCFQLHLSKSTEAFYDDCHFNESGAKATAEQIPTLIATVIPELTE